jgi:hypothetical protein
MSCIDPWIMSLYPFNPTVIIDRENVKEVLKDLCEGWPGRIVNGYLSRDFAIQNFSTKIILKKHLYLFDLIMNREAYMAGGSRIKIIYNF